MKKAGLGISMGVFSADLALALGGIWLYQWDAISLGFAGMIVSAIAIYGFTED